MKKAMSWVLMACILLCLAACGGGKTSVTGAVTDPTTQAASQEATNPPETGAYTGSTQSTTDKVTTAATEETEEPTEQTVPETTAEPTTEPEKPTQAEPTQPVKQPEPTQLPHAHSYSAAVTKIAGCTTDGVKTYICSCGDSYAEQLPAAGHIWGQWNTVKEPTMAAEGISQRKCSNCATTEEKPIAALPTDEPEEFAVTKAQLRRIEAGFLELVNEERNRVGVSSLAIDSHLDSCAQTRSKETIQSFSHTRPNGQSFSSIVDTRAYPYRTLGENICMTSHIGNGYYTDADKWVGSNAQIEAAYSWIYSCFRNSSGHYANMIKADYSDCGIGISFVMHDELPVPMFYVAHIFGGK